MSYPREEEEEEELPQQVADLAQATVPSALRGIRSCKRCGILKTLDQFINEGCENCPFLDMKAISTSTFAAIKMLLLHDRVVVGDTGFIGGDDDLLDGQSREM
eukprot:scaffold124175_cov49-Attheya_sp.AAC.3